MGITIVGLGPGDPNLLTREAWELLSSSEVVWLRTARHPTVDGLPSHLTLHSFDCFYESAEDFSGVYRTIASEVVRLGRQPGGVVYAVPGHPLVGEATVQHIIAAAEAEGMPVRIVEGISFVEPILTLLQVDALEGLQVCDAIDLANRYHPPLNPDLPALVGQIYSRALASDVKLVLMNQYPDELPVALIHAAGTPEAVVHHIPLFELDRHEVAHLTSLYVFPMEVTSGFEGFQETVAHLRAPDGCLWDQEQTHESLRSSLLEEAYEVVEAIDREDMAALEEELGDLLLQVVIQTQIGTEEGVRRLDVGNMNVTFLRFATACGMSERLRLDLVLNDFVACAVTAGEITVLSDGSPWRPLIDVEDMARAIAWAIERPASNGGQILSVNVGSDQWNYQVRDLAAAVATAIPGTRVSINTDAPPDKRSYKVDFGLYQKLAPANQPQITLEKSIERLRDGLVSMGFADKDFRNSPFMRLKTLERLMASGRLAPDLRWTGMAARA